MISGVNADSRFRCYWFTLSPEPNHLKSSANILGKNIEKNPFILYLWLVHTVLELMKIKCVPC